MAFCINCGQELAETAKFCSNCGKAVDENNSEQLRKSVYDGEIHKCPNCGDTIDAYETVCEACGFEIRGRKTTSIVHELALKLEKIDDIQKKEELIRNFYIPNTKEDIYEFMILANSNIGNNSKNESAWIAKFEQAYQKAKLTCKSDVELEFFHESYKKALKERKNNQLRLFTESKLFILLVFIVLGFLSSLLLAPIIGVMIIFWGIILFALNKNKN